MKGKLLRILAVLLLLVMLVPELASAEGFECTVYSNSMNVYKAQKTSSKKLGALKHGVQFTVLSFNNTWAYIRYKGNTGYAQVKDMKRVNGVPMYTNCRTKVYKTASTKATKLVTVTVDYPLYMVGMSGNFYLVEDKDGHFGGYVLKSDMSSKRKNPYKVSGSYVINYENGDTTTKIPTKAQSSRYYLATNDSKDEFRDYIVYLAQCKIGCKYKNVSYDNNKTFNNTTFVNSVYKVLGYKVNGNANAIGHKGTAPYISKSDLKKGDIVCFNCGDADGDLVDHIGIYCGSGYFIHASDTAKCVVISNMNSGYYSRTFCWGRRVIL